MRIQPDDENPRFRLLSGHAFNLIDRSGPMGSRARKRRYPGRSVRFVIVGGDCCGNEDEGSVRVDLQNDDAPQGVPGDSRRA